MKEVIAQSFGHQTDRLTQHEKAITQLQDILGELAQRITTLEDPKWADAARRADARVGEPHSPRQFPQDHSLQITVLKNEHGELRRALAELLRLHDLRETDPELYRAQSGAGLKNKAWIAARNAMVATRPRGRDKDIHVRGEASDIPTDGSTNVSLKEHGLTREFDGSGEWSVEVEPPELAILTNLRCPIPSPLGEAGVYVEGVIRDICARCDKSKSEHIAELQQ